MSARVGNRGAYFNQPTSVSPLYREGKEYNVGQAWTDEDLARSGNAVPQLDMFLDKSKLTSAVTLSNLSGVPITFKTCHASPIRRSEILDPANYRMIDAFDMAHGTTYNQLLGPTDFNVGISRIMRDAQGKQILVSKICTTLANLVYHVGFVKENPDAPGTIMLSNVEQTNDPNAYFQNLTPFDIQIAIYKLSSQSAMGTDPDQQNLGPYASDYGVPAIFIDNVRSKGQWTFSMPAQCVRIFAEDPNAEINVQTNMIRHINFPTDNDNVVLASLVVELGTTVVAVRSKSDPNQIILVALDNGKAKFVSSSLVTGNPSAASTVTV